VVLAPLARDLLAGRGHPAIRIGWVLLLGLSAAAGLFWARREIAITDEQLFRQAGDALLHGRLDEVYADPIVQAGPVQLVWVWLLQVYDAASPGLTLTAAGVAGVPVATLAAGYAVRAVRAVAGLPRHPGAELGIACLALAWGISEVAAFSGHPAEVAVPLAWLVAGVLARRGRPLVAGALVGFAAGWELWGVLGAAVLLLGPGTTRDRLRGLVAGGAVLVATVAALYLPFLASGEFRMFEYRWVVRPESLLGILRPAAVGDGFPWEGRLAQGAFAGLASVTAALALRRHWVAVWVVPLVAQAARIVLDPVLHGYYWTPILVLALAGLATSRLRTPLGLTACALCAWQAWPVGHTWWGTLLVTLPLAAACGVLAVRETGSGAGRPPQGRVSSPARVAHVP
jgi:hypothetical protein